jgi:hypothetical protein
MHTIKLDLKNRTAHGATHVNMLINDQDTGVLYLSEKELQLLTEVLKTGTDMHQDCRLEIEQPQQEEEFDFDVFE